MVPKVLSETLQKHAMGTKTIISKQPILCLKTLDLIDIHCTAFKFYAVFSLSGILQLLDLLHIPASLPSPSRHRPGHEGGVVPVRLQGGGKDLPLPDQGSGG